MSSCGQHVWFISVLFYFILDMVVTHDATRRVGYANELETINVFVNTVFGWASC